MLVMMMIMMRRRTAECSCDDDEPLQKVAHRADVVGYFQDVFKFSQALSMYMYMSFLPT